MRVRVVVMMMSARAMRMGMAVFVFRVGLRSLRLLLSLVLPFVHLMGLLVPMVFARFATFTIAPARDKC